MLLQSYSYPVASRLTEIPTLSRALACDLRTRGCGAGMVWHTLSPPNSSKPSQKWAQRVVDWDKLAAGDSCCWKDSGKTDVFRKLRLPQWDLESDSKLPGTIMLLWKYVKMLNIDSIQPLNNSESCSQVQELKQDETSLKSHAAAIFSIKVRLAMASKPLPGRASPTSDIWHVDWHRRCH